MFRHIPDFIIYGVIVLLIYLNAQRAADKDHAPQPPPPPQLGPMLPQESPRDASVLVEMDEPTSGIGTAFAIDDKGNWLTARHVVDGCDEVGLNLGQGRAIVARVAMSSKADTAILSTEWSREPLPVDFTSTRRLGEQGYFFGFPQGKPGEVAGTLLGRRNMIIRGRYNTKEGVLAWTEVGRTRGLTGSLGGLSGGPVLDADGEVMGLVAAESPRRGRIYTVAPKTLAQIIEDPKTGGGKPITLSIYGTEADHYRRARRIAQVLCLVE